MLTRRVRVGARRRRQSDGPDQEEREDSGARGHRLEDVCHQGSLRKPVEPYGRYGTGAGNEDVPMRDISTIYGNLPEPDPPENLGAKLLELLSR